MEKSLFEQIGGIYHEESDYLIPNLALPAEKEQTIGIWGQRHLRYIKQYKRGLYTNLLTSGKLNAYLADINKQAENMFFQLVKAFADRQGETEQLKVDSPMEWVGRMNIIRNAVEEVISKEIIYA